MIAVLGTRLTEFLPGLAGELQDAGLGTNEIPIGTPDSVLAISVLSETPATVGAGEVAEVGQAEAVIAAGAWFVCCPRDASGVIPRCAERSLAALVRASRPDEGSAAGNHGASALMVSHPPLLRSSWARRMAVAPEPIPLVATGAIDDRIAGDYIRAGARAVRVEDWLVGDAAQGGDLGALSQRARRLMTAVSTASLA